MQSSDHPTASPELTATSSVATTGGFPWRTAILVVGDALSFLVFASAGRGQHAEALSFSQVLLTAWPFALGWFLVAPWMGAYRERLTTGAFSMLKRTELAWIAAYPVVLLSRFAFSPDHQIPLTFAIIILVANALFLGAWRTAFAWLSAKIDGK